MTPAIKPLLLHAMREYSDGLKQELALLRSGELRREDSRSEEIRARYPTNYMSRWSDPTAARAEPVFLRLGMPIDISSIPIHGASVVLALDARVLRAHAFQLNQGWWKNPTNQGASLRYVQGAVLDGRAMADAALFAHLKALDRARRRAFCLNGLLAKARTGACMQSNEILVDGPVSLAESLRVVFVPTGLPAADAAKLRALVAKRYPLARVEEYAYEQEN